MAFPSDEYALIRRLQNLLPKRPALSPFELTIGDDAAVRVNNIAGERLIITADISVENVHFSTGVMTFEEIGYKSMVSNLSDCAAMGATPDSATVQLVFPKNRKDADINGAIEKIYAGFAKACERWDFPIVGGDLSGGDSWVVGITLMGAVSPNDRIVKRAGIVDGDILWITGMPGESAAGLACLRHFGRNGVPTEYQRLINAHISPVPKISEGKAFAARKDVRAMMDLSDGLSKDVATLCYDNNLGFVFERGLTPSTEMKSLADRLGTDWKDWFYHGGEEYELLLSCDPSYTPQNCMKLGRFTSEFKGVNLFDDNGIMTTLPSNSWDHISNEAARAVDRTT